MTSRHRTRLVGWHPSDPAAVAWLDAEIQRRGGGRGTQSAILDEALAEYRAEIEAERARQQIGVFADCALHPERGVS